jgi:dipeptidyl aminopeptidase/acylaminoacyl peptidase
MCIFGYSNGAMTTELLVTRYHKFKCAIAASGYPDMAFGPFFLGNAYTSQLVEGVQPWQDPSLYAALSPIYHVDSITTPMLLTSGDKDLGFLLPQIEMYNALRSAGREVTFVRYPGQLHVLEGRSLQDFWQRVYAFLDTYLQSAK